MSETMNLSVNGHSQVPPGFRFHPTEEELLHYYLRKKVSSIKIDLDVIPEVDLNKLEPWDIQEKCKIGSTPQNDWYFFSHKDKKYPTGTRTNRATAAGFWKATGRDKIIQSNGRRIGMRKTLVFYGGRAPHGQKSDWIMHEYRLDENTAHDNTYASKIGGEPGGAEDGWVVCRIFKKKNYPTKASPEHPLMASHTTPPDGILDQILKYMGRSSASGKQETESNGYDFADPEVGFSHLPGLEIPPNNSELIGPSSDWVALDRLVASQLNGQHFEESSINNEDFSFPFDQDDARLVNLHDSDDRPDPEISSLETDFWTFARSSSSLSSSSDPLSHLSV